MSSSIEDEKYYLSAEEELFYFNKIIDKYYCYLHNEGLDLNDYRKIKKTFDEINKLRRVVLRNWSNYLKYAAYYGLCEKYLIELEERRCLLDRYDRLLNDCYDLLKLLEEKIVPQSLGSFLQKEGSLFHLVFTNNVYDNIKLCGIDSYLFICQFHEEKSPSLSINNEFGIGSCYGCKTTFNMARYIMLREKMTYRKAVKLLARIYLIEINDDEFDEENKLVIKYRKGLFSDRYKELLLRGQERAIKREDIYGKKHALLKFEHDLKTIDRIKQEEWLHYQDGSDKPSRLVMKLPEFDE